MAFSQASETRMGKVIVTLRRKKHPFCGEAALHMQKPRDQKVWGLSAELGGVWMACRAGAGEEKGN